MQARTPCSKGLFAFALGEGFQFEPFDWDRDAQTFVDIAGPFIDVNPDLREFGRRGGKLLLYTGGTDNLTSPEDAINFYNKANKASKQEHGGPQAINSYALLFVLPGMDHCFGGLGPDHFDQMSAIMHWTEEGIAPIPLSTWKQEANGSVTNKQRLCPYIPETTGSTSRKKTPPQEWTNSESEMSFLRRPKR